MQIWRVAQTAYRRYSGRKSSGYVFSDKLNIILLKLPCIDAQSLSECGEFYEKLSYLLNQMTTDMRTIEELKVEFAATQLPEQTKEVLCQVLDMADVGSLSENEQLIYESNLKACCDTKSCIRFAEHSGCKEGREEGREEDCEEGRAGGMAQGELEIARSMKSDGITSEIISKYTGLSAMEIENL